MLINILLPHKEKFSKKKASSVSITVSNNLEYSSFKNEISVFGQYVDDPMHENFYGIKDTWNFFRSKNVNLAIQMCKFIEKKKLKKSIIELHNRPYLAKLVKSKLIKHSVNLFLHNNPLEMKGSKSKFERQLLLKNIDRIYCVSNFVKKKFLVDINDSEKKVKVLYNGVKRKIKSRPKKTNLVVFVGRIVPEKGVDLFVNAIKIVHDKFLNWEFKMVGSTKLGSNETDYFSKKIVNKFNKIGSRVSVTGYLNSDELESIMKKSSIIIIPSIWEEPFGLVAAEAMSYGTAILASNSGGLSEVIGKNGILIDDINEFKIARELSNLIKNKKLLNKYQKLAWDNFSFTSLASSRKLDKFRKEILYS